jgi:hypothetical protein
MWGSSDRWTVRDSCGRRRVVVADYVILVTFAAGSGGLLPDEVNHGQDFPAKTLCVVFVINV